MAITLGAAASVGCDAYHSAAFLIDQPQPTVEAPESIQICEVLGDVAATYALSKRHEGLDASVLCAFSSASDHHPSPIVLGARRTPEGPIRVDVFNAFAVPARDDPSEFRDIEAAVAEALAARFGEQIRRAP